MARHGKRMRQAKEKIDRNATYSIEDAVKLVKERAKVKFDETIDIAMNLGVDPRHADQMVRGVVDLPNGTGRSVKVAVFAKGDKADEAKKAGADIVGADELVATVEKGTIEFDRCIATPDMMPLVGKLGKVLGPRGLMPNPKVGTVTPDVAAAVQSAKGGAVEFRVEKAGIIHAGVGKASFHGDSACRKYPGVYRRGDQGQAHGRQGNVFEEDRDQLDHGSGRADRDQRHRSAARRSLVEFRGGTPLRIGWVQAIGSVQAVQDCGCRVSDLIPAIWPVPARDGRQTDLRASCAPVVGLNLA